MSNIEQALKNSIDILNESFQTENDEQSEACRLNVRVWNKYVTETIKQCKSALSEIDKCEPVGWYCKACKETGLSHCSDPENCGGMVRTYTSPISKEWVGLSDAEIHNIYIYIYI